MNLAEILHSSAERRADRSAVTDVRSGRALTYGMLAREAERVAAFLTAQGVEPGQRIALLAPNSSAYLPAAFGLLATGACLVPLATNLTPTEMDRILGEIDVNGRLRAPQTGRRSGPTPRQTWPAGKIRRFPPDEAVASSGERRIPPGGECEGFTFEWIRREARGPEEFRQLDAAFVRFTSGTTAACKGVVLSHDATLARVRAADAVLHLGPHDRILWVLPLAYHFAVTMVAYVRAGAHILMCPTRRRTR
jgi:long-chain acyl-CoA synthetase